MDLADRMAGGAKKCADREKNHRLELQSARRRRAHHASSTTRDMRGQYYKQRPAICRTHAAS
jgi:hypothetical protein